MRFLFGLSLWIFIGVLNGSVAAHGESLYLYRSTVDETLDAESLKQIFLGEHLTWDNGSNIVLLIDVLDKVSDESFKKFSGISKVQYLSRWRVKFFSGRALIPIQAKSSSFVLDTLKSNPSSIFISFEELPDSILGAAKDQLKIIKISY